MSELTYSGTLTGEDYSVIQEQHIPNLESEMVDSEVEIQFDYEEQEVEIHARYPHSHANRTEHYAENEIKTSLEEFSETLEALDGDTTEETGVLQSMRGISKYLIE